jgi:hypothetical protein
MWAARRPVNAYADAHCVASDGRHDALSHACARKNLRLIRACLLRSHIVFVYFTDIEKAVTQIDKTLRKQANQSKEQTWDADSNRYAFTTDA